MSIYNPPSKTQGIFNPSNYGGLGAGGEITIDYLKSSFLEFPVAQGNTTLVGTSVFGNISQQQGDFSTTGDLLVNDVNVITEIGTKQDTIGNGDLDIAFTSGLQTALDNKYDDTGGTINGNTTISGDLVVGTTNIISEIDTKQDEITTATNLIFNSLSTTQLFVNEFLYFDTIVIRRPSNATGYSDYVINLRELQCWVNNVNILADNSENLITYFALWSDKENDISVEYNLTQASDIHNNIFTWAFGNISIHSPSEYSDDPDVVLIIKNIPTTLIDSIQSLVLYNSTGGILNERTLGLAIELYNEENDPTLINLLASTNEISVKRDVYRFDFNSIDSYTSGFVDEDSITNIVSESYAFKEVVNRDVTIIDGNITCHTINTSGNVDVGGNLVVGTTNIITALNGKQDTIEDGDLSISNTSGLQSSLNGKQDTIEDGDLSISNISGLQTALNDKQDEITTDTDLTLNSMTTDALIVNHSLSVDTRKYFDTIVLRRPTGLTGEAGDFYIALRELQFWIGGSNILQSSGFLESLFANWEVDKEADLGALGGGSINDASKLYNNVISNEYDAHSKEGNSTSDIALIIKGLPLNLIETIQALVLYNRTGSFNNTTIGLAIEVYNSTQDPTLTEILANTRVITNAVDVYRFDFPDIATYTGFATGESLNNIIREEDATSEVVSVVESPTEMVGGLMVNTITLPTIGDVETAIQGKQNELTTGANIIIEGDEIPCDLTAGTNIDITSGVISTTGLQNELTTGANISIEGDEISCDLTAGTNIDITSGVISTTGLQNELTTGANITIEDDEISCDLTAGTNIRITDGVISSIVGETDGTGVDDTTDLNVKTITSVGNINVGGVIIAPNQPSFRAYPSADDTVNGTTTLPFDTIDFDNKGGYDTTDYEYTVPVAGIWLFTWSCGVVEDRNYLSSIKKNNVIYDRSIIDAAQCLRTFDTISAKGLTIMSCVVGDKIKITVNGNGQSASVAGTLESYLDADTQFNSFAGVLIG